MSVLSEFGAGVEQRPSDCQCPDHEKVEGVDLIPCWPCSRAGFTTVNPDAGDSDD